MAVGPAIYDETKYGKLPIGWSITKLGKACSKEVKKFEPRDASNVFRYVGLEHIESDSHRLLSYGQSNDTLSTKNVFSTGSILYGKLRPYLNKVWKARFDGVCSTEIFVFNSRNEMEQQYLYFLLQQKRFIEYANAMTEGTSLPRVNWNDIRNYEVALPPLSEQQKIAEILSTVDETIEKTNAIIEENRQLKKGLMQKLFTEGIGHTRFKETKIGRIPEEWEVVNLVDAFQVIDGDRGVNYPKADELLADGDCVFLNANNVTKTGFKFNEIQFITKEKDEALRKGKLARGDLVLTTRGTLGNFAFYSDNIPFEHLRINSGMVVLRPLDDVVANFHYKYFTSYLMQNQIERISSGTAQPQLTVGGIQKLRLLKFSREEQCEIAEILSEVDANIETEEAFKSELEQLKKGLMQVLLTGKVRV